MKISEIEIKNFRLLETDIKNQEEGVKIALENDFTIIVGKNNSGKTSMTDIFAKFTGQAKFEFEDFSINTYLHFNKAVTLFKEYKQLKKDKDDKKVIEKKQNEIQNILPQIELNIKIEYDKEKDYLGSISSFILDLDETKNVVLLSAIYKIKKPLVLLDDYLSKNEDFDNFIEYLRNNNDKFERELYAIDATNNKNKKEQNISELSRIFITRFIHAQRDLDDNAIDNSQKLSRALEFYYKTNNKDNQNASFVEKALQKASKDIDPKYNTFFNDLYNSLKNDFNYPNLNADNLIVKSFFKPETVLQKNIKLFYQKTDDILLPENANGLGYSNLIYIILQFFNFYTEHQKHIEIDKKTNNFNESSLFQLLFIEEPEAHLHPQMQQAFVRQLNKFIKENKWPVQIVITTHSSHIIAESGTDEDKGFKNIRYFNLSNQKLEIKNLAHLKFTDRDTTKFLKQYLEITKSDLFFADKVILVEGTTERMLMPLMIKRLNNSKLLNQYTSIIEVGGAYAYKFLELLDFIGVKTLVITDIDTVKSKKNINKKGNKQIVWSACPVLNGEKTSNENIKNWDTFKNLTIEELKTVKEKDKIIGNVRIAFQIPEKNKKCGRSLEEAILIKNTSIFAERDNLLASKDFFKDKKEDDILENSYVITEKLLKKISKTDFTFDLMQIDNWQIPLYITEGLKWLEKDN